MGIVKQTIICIVIGFVFLACEACDNEISEKLTNNIENVLLKDYSICDIKQTCVNTISNVKNLKEKTANAIEYTEETMANYRQDVI